MSSEAIALDAEDKALLERVARKIAALHLEVPALLTLEGGRPLSLLAGQAMVFFQPFVAAFLRVKDYGRFASLIERREALDVLIQLIESEAEAAHAARRAAAAARRAARPPRS